jgi:hypothetical protein
MTEDEIDINITEIDIAYTNSAGKPEARRPLGRCRRRQKV